MPDWTLTCYLLIPVGTSGDVGDCRQGGGALPGFVVVRVKPLLSPEEQDRIYGPRLYARDVAAYNRMRKVEPLNMAMDDYCGWVTGLRRADSEHRADAPALSLDRTGRLKISPVPGTSTRLTGISQTMT